MMDQQCTDNRPKIKGVIVIAIMTVAQFAKAARISPQAVTAALRKGQPHKGIVSYKRFGHQWSLEVVKELIEKK